MLKEEDKFSNMGCARGSRGVARRLHAADRAAHWRRSRGSIGKGRARRIPIDDLALHQPASVNARARILARPQRQRRAPFASGPVGARDANAFLKAKTFSVPAADTSAAAVGLRLVFAG